MTRNLLILLAAIPAIIAAAPCSAQQAASRDWSPYQAGDRVEIDRVCTGSWVRATVLAVGPGRNNPSAQQYTVRLDQGQPGQGHQWNFNAPALYAPCVRPPNAASVQPAAPSSALSGRIPEGLYMQTQGVYLGNSIDFQRVYFYFWADGRLCRGTPPGGTSQHAIDFNAMQQSGATCGQYRVGADKLVVLWQGETEADEMTLRNFRGDSFEMNGYATARVQ